MKEKNQLSGNLNVDSSSHSWIVPDAKHLDRSPGSLILSHAFAILGIDKVNPDLKEAGGHALHNVSCRMAMTVFIYIQEFWTPNLRRPGERVPNSSFSIPGSSLMPTHWLAPVLRPRWQAASHIPVGHANDYDLNHYHNHNHA